MSEEHRIVGLARGEPLSAGRVGVRLRFPLSGTPSPRWSRDLSARLTMELVGRPAVGHLRVNGIVQGAEIVLEGVEPDEASSIAGAVERAVDRANSDCEDGKAGDEALEVKAEAVARDVRATQRPPDANSKD